MANDGAGEAEQTGGVLETGGPFAGWRRSGNDKGFEPSLGPFYWKREGEEVRCGFLAEPRHLNMGGTVHGGCLLSFADFALFMFSSRAREGDHAVTVSLNGEFLGAVFAGDRVEATGDVTRAGKGLVFVRGLLAAEGRPALNFSGVIKRLRPRPA